MKFLPISLTLTALIFASCASMDPQAQTITKDSQAATSPDQAFQRLKDGNQRFVAGTALNRDHKKQVKETAKGQHPVASIVSCLDSRTSSELIFDQGIGDVFNARVAGNVINKDILGSLEFASKAAGSKLIAVVGHTKCGAVKGACDEVKLGNLTELLEKIDVAVDKTPSAGGADRSSKNATFVDAAATTNVRMAIDNIRKLSPILRDMEKEGKIKIVGGMHDIETGVATWLN